jgi:hypothetical protein
MYHAFAFQDPSRPAPPHPRRRPAKPRRFRSVNLKSAPRRPNEARHEVPERLPDAMILALLA